MVESVTISAIPNRRISAVRGSTEDMVEAVLDSDFFNEGCLDFLGSRSEYPETSRYLAELIEQRGKGHREGKLLQCLVIPTVIDVQINRVALAIGLLGDEPTFLKFDALCELANGTTKHANKAKLVLALMGQPTVPWAEATKEIRAGYLLGRLVATMRNDLR